MCRFEEDEDYGPASYLDRCPTDVIVSHQLYAPASRHHSNRNTRGSSVMLLMQVVIDVTCLTQHGGIHCPISRTMRAAVKHIIEEMRCPLQWRSAKLLIKTIAFFLVSLLMSETEPLPSSSTPIYCHEDPCPRSV